MPLYLWLPAAYAGTSAPVAALFAIMTKVGAYGILRVHDPDLRRRGGPARGPDRRLAAAAGPGDPGGRHAGRPGRDRLRRQIAYLVVASVGHPADRLRPGHAAGIAAGLYYLPHSTFAAAALFLLADLIAPPPRRPGRPLDPARSSGAMGSRGACLLCRAVAVGGLPPLSGFIGKFLILRAALGTRPCPGSWAVVLLAACWR